MTAPDSRRAAQRLAVACLVAHAALITFSAVAFATFLTGAPPAWLQSPANQRMLALGWRFGPATTVVLGALAGALHAGGRLGARRAAAIFVGAFAVSLGAELAGTSTGYPFGPYSYTPLLGYRVAGLVPFNIPTSWFYMLYCALAMTARMRGTRGSRWGWAALAGLTLTAWDVSMDPAMVRTAHWLWHLAPPTSTLHRVFVSDAFYGMPLSNWLGWLLTGTLVARLMLAIVPPAAWLERVAPTRLPLVLYAVNGILPLTICARYGMWWAFALGAAAMVLPLAMSLRARARASAAAPDAVPNAARSGGRGVATA